MGIVLETGEVNDSCLEKLKLGEPFFLLRAQDRTADILVAVWAMAQERTKLAMLAGMEEDEAVAQVRNDLFSCFAGQHATSVKTKEAFGIATKMAEWPVKKIAD